MSHKFALRAARLRQLPAAWAFALLAVMCVFQTLGFAHAVAHQGHRKVLVHFHSEQDHSHALHHDHGSHAVLERLFSGHEDGESDCRLYDQSTSCDALASLPLLALSLGLTPFAFSTLPGLVLARWHALAQARGPPFIR